MREREGHCPKQRVWYNPISINLCACACLFFKNRKRNFDIMDFDLYCISFLNLLRGDDIFYFCMLTWQIILGDLMQNHSPFSEINKTWPWFFFLLAYLKKFWQLHKAYKSLVPWPVIYPAPSMVETQSPNHWTTR